MTAVTVLVTFQWPILSISGEVLADAIPFPLVRDLFPVAAAAGLLWLGLRIGEDLGFA